MCSHAHSLSCDSYFHPHSRHHHLSPLACLGTWEQRGPLNISWQMLFSQYWIYLLLVWLYSLLRLLSSRYPTSLHLCNHRLIVFTEATQTPDDLINPTVALYKLLINHWLLSANRFFFLLLRFGTERLTALQSAGVVVVVEERGTPGRDGCSPGPSDGCSPGPSDGCSPVLGVHQGQVMGVLQGLVMGVLQGPVPKDPWFPCFSLLCFKGGDLVEDDCSAL